MTKIALLIDTWFPYVGGGQTNAFEISKRVAKKNITIDVITRNNGRSRLKLPRNLKVYKLGSYAKPFDLISKTAFIFRSFIFVFRHNYDLVHAHAFLPGITAKLLSVTKRMPTVFTVHGTSINTNLNNPFKRWLEKLILTQLIYSAQITVSHDFLKIKNNNKNINYIPNGVDLAPFKGVGTRKKKDPTLLFIGRLHPQKNLLKLVQALSIVRKGLPSLHLTIVGDGPQRPRIKKLIKELKLTRTVKLTGQLFGKDLIRVYKTSHFLILPSIYEGQPLVMLEAWAAKTPVIASNTGECRYLVKDGKNGYLIDNPSDHYAIAKIIKKALAKNNSRTLGANGYNLVKNNFSWEKASIQTQKIYNALLISD